MGVGLPSCPAAGVGDCDASPPTDPAVAVIAAATAVASCSGVGVCVGTIVGVGICVGDGEEVMVGVGAGVWDGVGVSTGVGVGVGVCVLEGVGVGVGVLVLVGVFVCVGVRVLVGVEDGFGVLVGVWVLVEEGVMVGVSVGVGAASIVAWTLAAMTDSVVAWAASCVAALAVTVASTSGGGPPHAAHITAMDAAMTVMVALLMFRNGLTNVLARSGRARFESVGAFLCEGSLDGDVDVAGDGLGYWAAVLGGLRRALEALRSGAWHVASDGEGAAGDLPSDFLLRECNGCADFELGRGSACLREPVGQCHTVAGGVGRSEQFLRAGRPFFAVRSRCP